MIKKVLIANRGEIAIRIIRACREMGVRTVAVYSTGDTEALHAQLADEAVCIGPVSLKESYLNTYAILSAAEATGADAIHPGYGFLSENSKFARVCMKSGIKFIGPAPEAMELMGDKITARRLMKENGVPIIPGTTEPLETPEAAEATARELGFPVMIKASAGGGGRGIRKVTRPEDVRDAWMSARAEAEAAFGDGTLFMEKCIENGRHLEVQVLADEHGNAIHLFERECSLQRRNQKVMEEAPSCCLDDERRREMGEAAVRAARASGYTNAGTIEFLVDDSGYYFMELNARVQVEHPVTEMATGIDIVKAQLLIASGEPLSIRQEDVRLLGHAIECRINAEDTDKNFMPSIGRITMLHVPGGPGVRFDSMLYNGYEIPPYFDSMVGKLICMDKDRESAMAKMRSALTEMVIDGVETNIDFQLDLLTNKKVLRGELDTGLVERIMEET